MIAKNDEVKYGMRAPGPVVDAMFLWQQSERLKWHSLHRAANIGYR